VGCRPINTARSTTLLIYGVRLLNFSVCQPSLFSVWPAWTAVSGCMREAAPTSLVFHNFFYHPPIPAVLTQRRILFISQQSRTVAPTSYRCLHRGTAVSLISPAVGRTRFNWSTQPPRLLSISEPPSVTILQTVWLRRGLLLLGKHIVISIRRISLPHPFPQGIPPAISARSAVAFQPRPSPAFFFRVHS
jgi:hypothetical protein